MANSNARPERNYTTLLDPQSRVDRREDELRFTSISILRERVLCKLADSGFIVSNNEQLIVPNDKEYFRKVHSEATKYMIRKNSKLIQKFDEYFIEKYVANGTDLDVKCIDPKLVKVTDEKKGNLFRWIKLHWSIPISAGYGRRLRYILYDKNNGVVIGIIGLADPVFGLRDRDEFIGWDYQTKKSRLKHIMDAFVLGAIPPYSMILGGKLVAASLMSSKIRQDFFKQYKGSVSIISGNVFNGKLAAITTASALGKSSIYDRIKVPRSSAFFHIGWSKGSGEFHFTNGLYEEMFKLVSNRVKWTKNPLWGNGTRNRRVVVQQALRMMDLPSKLIYHNIPRELFMVPLGSNTVKFLQGKSREIGYYKISNADLFKYSLDRWVIPRSQRRKEYLSFDKDSYSLLSSLRNSNDIQ